MKKWFKRFIALLAVTACLLSSGADNLSMVKAEDGSEGTLPQSTSYTDDSTGVTLTFTPQKIYTDESSGKLTEDIRIDASAASGEIQGITDPDNKFHEGTSFVYQATSNGGVSFSVKYMPEDAEETKTDSSDQQTAEKLKEANTDIADTDQKKSGETTDEVNTETPSEETDKNAITTDPSTVDKTQSAIDNQNTPQTETPAATDNQDVTPAETPAADNVQEVPVETPAETEPTTETSEENAAVTPTARLSVLSFFHDPFLLKAHAAETTPKTTSTDTNSKNITTDVNANNNTTTTNAKANDAVEATPQEVTIPYNISGLMQLPALTPQSNTSIGGYTINVPDGFSISDKDIKASELDAWLADQCSGVTATNGSSTLSMQTYGAESEYGEKSPVKNWEYGLTVVAVPTGSSLNTEQQQGTFGDEEWVSNRESLTGGAGSADVYVVLYDSNEQIVGNSKICTINSLNTYLVTIVVDPENVTISKGTAYDLMTGVTAHEENGTDISNVCVTDNGNFDANTNGTYTITYGAVDPRNNDTVYAKRSITIADTGVVAKESDITAYIVDDDIKDQFDYIADGTLLNKLKSNFKTESGTQIDSSKVSIDDDGGYEPSEGTYTIVYEIEYPDKVYTKKSINVNVVSCKTWTTSLVLVGNIKKTYSFSSANDATANTYNETVVAGDTSMPLYGMLQMVKGKDAASEWATENKLTSYENCFINGALVNNFSARNEVYLEPLVDGSYSYREYTGFSKYLGGNYDVAINNGGFDLNTPGTYTITVSGKYKDTVKVKGTINVTVTENTFKFKGTNDIKLLRQTDNKYDLLKGVSACDNFKSYKVTVENDGGFDVTELGTYIVTYIATDALGKTHEATKKFTVVDSTVTSDSTIEITLVKPDEFVLGAYGQEYVTTQVKYKGDVQNSGRVLSVNIPYGFELVSIPDDIGIAKAQKDISGNYDDPNGTTITYSIDDGIEAKTNFSFQTKVHLDLLSADLTNDSAYVFSANSITDQQEVATDTLSLNANRKLTDLKNTAISVTRYMDLVNTGLQPGYYSSGAKIKLTNKSADFLPQNLNWALNFTVPDEVSFPAKNVMMSGSKPNYKRA